MTMPLPPRPFALSFALLVACSPPANDVGEDLESSESSAASTTSPSTTDSASMSSTSATTSATSTTDPTDPTDDSATTDVTSTSPTTDTDVETGSTTDAESSTTSDPPAAGMVLFVNFDGETLVGGEDDSRTNTTGIAEMVGDFAAYGGGDRDQILALVEGHWAPFAVLVTDERPTDGDYTMVMAGPTNPFGGGIGGIGLQDCDNANANNIAFAFIGGGDGLDTDTRARFISHTAGDTLGLDHVTLEGDLMDPQNTGNTFLDECGDRMSNTCALASDACPDGQQNSYQELATRFGES